MGTYSELRIGHLEIFPSKSHPPWFALTLFRPGDRSVSTDAEGYVTCAYRITAATAKQRLHVMGFTMKFAREDYRGTATAELERLRETYEDECNKSGTYAQREVARITSVDFDSYFAACRHIFASGDHPFDLRRQGDTNPVVVRIADDYFNDDYHWGFYCQDPRSLVRVLLEVVPGDTVVEVDMTALIDAGYFQLDEDVVSIALEERRGTYAVDSAIIVLVEGVTDAEVLSRSMALLYPQLRDYYRFLDYAARPEGGAAQLVRAVRAFIAAGIENRIVAMFDNDAEGHHSLLLLQRQTLPSNVRAFTYPDIALAREYPTRGPTGESQQNVNGAAASVELYFGEDVLRDSSGRLAPIDWKGRIEGIARYQGEVEKKSELKDRFFAKLALCETRPTAVDDSLWTEMRQLLNRLFVAFQD